MTCKNLLHAQWGQWRLGRLTLGGNGATSIVETFRRCLELHQNSFTTSIKFVGSCSTATSDNPCTFDLPYRCVSARAPCMQEADLLK